MSETANGTTTLYLVDEWTPTSYAQVAEETVSGAVTVQFTYGLMRIGQNRAGVVSYYGYDAGGSTRELIDSSGTVTDTYEYDAFGNTVFQSGSTVNEFKYRGEQLDTALQMYYLRARYYIPKTGRFLTMDKYESCPFKCCPDSYSYTDADPVNKTDPSGNTVVLGVALQAPEDFDAALLQGAIVGAGTCMLGYVGSILTIEIAGWGRDVTNIAIHLCFFSATYGDRPGNPSDWRNPNNRVPPPVPPRNPGRCTPQQHAELQSAVDIECKMKWSCSANDSPATLGIKIGQGSVCVAARLAIEIACFDFSDKGHPAQLAQETVRLSNCFALAANNE